MDDIDYADDEWLDDEEEDFPEPKWPDPENLEFVVVYTCAQKHQKEFPQYPFMFGCYLYFDVYYEDGTPYDQHLTGMIEDQYPMYDFSKLDEGSENNFTLVDQPFCEISSGTTYPFSTKEEFAAWVEKLTGIKFTGKFEIQ